MSGILTAEAAFYNLDYYGRPIFFTEVYGGNNVALRTIFAALRADKLRSLLNTRIRTQSGQTMAHVACFGSADKETIAILLDNGADFMLPDDAGRLPFDIAANAADPAVIEFLLALGPDATALVEHKDNLGRTPFHALCMPGSSAKEKGRDHLLMDSLELLLNVYGTDIDAKVAALNASDIFDISPLMYAKHFNFHEILNFAVEMGITLNEIPDIPEDSPALQRDYWDRNAVMEIVFDQDWFIDPHTEERTDLNEAKLAHALRKPTDQNDPTAANHQFGKRNTLHYAVGGGTPVKVRMVLDDNGRRRTNPTAVDVNGSTALHFAASRGNVDILTILLENDAINQNINIVDHFGMNALHALAMNIKPRRPEQQLQCARLLVLTHKIDLFAKNKFGHTPREVAELRGNADVADLLKELEKQHSCLWSFTDQAYAAKRSFQSWLGYKDETTTEAAPEAPATAATSAPRIS